MASFTLSHGGTSYDVTVPDSFSQLPQDQQAAQLTQAFGAYLKNQSGASQTPGSSAAGFDPTQPYEVATGSGTQPPATPSANASGFDPAQPYEVATGSGTPPQVADGATDTSLSGALGYGVQNTARSLGNTADVLGLPGAQTLRGVNTAPKNYQPVSLTGDIANGRWSSLPGDVLRKGAEMLPAIGGSALAAGAAAAAAPEALAAGVGLGAAGLTSAALRYGDNVKAAQANNNDAAPTTGDYVRGAATTLPQAALDAVGLRVPGLGGIATGALGRAAVRTGADATSAALSDQVGQVGDSIGTTQGLQDNPQQSLEAGLGALPARAMTTAPSLAKAGVQGANEAVLSRTTPQPADADQASAILQAGQAMDAARSSMKGNVSDAAATNAAKANVAATLSTTFRALRSNYPELVSSDDATSFQTALAEARRIGSSVEPFLSDIEAMQLPPEATAPLVQGLRTLDVLSDPSFTTRAAPLATLGGLAGQAIGIGGGYLADGGTGVIAGVLGHSIARRIGTAVGGAADSVLGTNLPASVLQQAAAQRMLGRLGSPTPNDPVGALQAVRDAATTSRAVQVAQAQAAAVKAQQTNAAWTTNANPPPMPTASPDFAKALGQVPATASDPSASYLAGRAVPGMDGATTTGQQTAAEIAGWAQMQRNHAVALADAQRAMRVGVQATAALPENAAQAMIDKATRLNAANLATAGLSSSSGPTVGDVASDAAVAQALRRANAVRALAGTPTLDALGNPVDPVPTNTPIRASTSVPQTLNASQAPTVASGDPSTPTSSLKAPGGMSSQAPQSGPAPWKRYVAYGAPGITADHIDQAIDAVTASGGMTPQYAQALRAHQGVAPAAVLQPIQAEAARIAAADRGAVGLMPTPTGGSGFGPLPTDGTVRRPAAYLLATQAYHADADALAGQARQAGMLDTAHVVVEIQHTRDPAVKAAIRNAYLASISDPTERASASALLPDRLVTHGAR